MKMTITNIENMEQAEKLMESLKGVLDSKNSASLKVTLSEGGRELWKYEVCNKGVFRLDGVDLF